MVLVYPPEALRWPRACVPMMLSQSWQPDSERLNDCETTAKLKARNRRLATSDKKQFVIYTVKGLAHVKQNYSRQVLFLSIAVNMMSVVWITKISVECFSLFPLCLVDKRPFHGYSARVLRQSSYLTIIRRRRMEYLTIILRSRVGYEMIDS